MTQIGVQLVFVLEVEGVSDAEISELRKQIQHQSPEKLVHVLLINQLDYLAGYESTLVFSGLAAFGSDSDGKMRWKGGVLIDGDEEEEDLEPIEF